MTDLADALASELDHELHDVDARLAAASPGDAGSRQPVHTVYVPADRYTRDTAARWGAEALAALDAHAPDLSDVWGVPDELAGELTDRVRRKLGTEPKGCRAVGTPQEESSTWQESAHTSWTPRSAVQPPVSPSPWSARTERCTAA